MKKIRSLLAIVLAVALLLTSFALSSVAAETTGEEVITIIANDGDELYDILSEELPRGHKFRVEVSGTLKYETYGSHNSDPFSLLPEGAIQELTIVGTTANAKFVQTGIGVDSMELVGGKLIFKDITIEDTTVYTHENGESAWEFCYAEYDGEVAFYNCVIRGKYGGIMTNGTAYFEDCDFIAEKLASGHGGTEYALWINNGSATLKNCTFTGRRAFKFHEQYGSDVDTILLDSCVFNNVTEKPGIAIGKVDETTVVTIKNSQFYNCQPGDQGLYMYESDTDVTTFDFTEENNIVCEGEHVLVKKEASAPSCVADGNVVYWTCEACETKYADENGKTVLTSVVDPATGHSLTTVPAKDATCTEKGNVLHYACSTCGDIFSDAEGENPLTTVEVAAKGHTLTKTTAKDATCTEKGNVEYYTCSACHKTFSDAEGKNALPSAEVAAKGHTLKAVAEVAATYSADGVKAHYACACGALFADAEGKTAVTKAELLIPMLIKVEENQTEEKIEVTVTVTTDTVDKAIEEAKEEETKEVVINLDKVVEDNVAPEVIENAEITTAEIPVASLEKVTELGKDATLTVQKNDVTVALDAKTLETITETAKDNNTATITLEVTKNDVTDVTKSDELKEEQKEAVADKKVVAVISASIMSGEKEIHDFKGGSVTVSIPFTPAEGTKGEDYVVLYVADDGKVEEVKTTYKDGKLEVVLDHFSKYVVVNTTLTNSGNSGNSGAANDSQPATGGNSNAVLLIALMSLALVGALTLLLQKKKLVR